MPNFEKATLGQGRTGRPRTPIAERFWPKVEKTNDCWWWRGAKNEKGYGLLNRGGGKTLFILAHRFSWEFHNGPIPAGMCVLHKCDHPGCVRPDHLFLGTRTDNANDKAEKGRAPNGEWHYNVKLSDDQVREIREWAKSRVVVNVRAPKGKGSELGYASQAIKYGVTEWTIRQIVQGKRRTRAK